MLLRSGIVAGFIGLIFAGLACGWVELMAEFGVNWWLSVAPIPVFLLFATWLRAPAWINERTGWRPTTRVALSLVLPLIGIVAATVIFRIHQIPYFDPGFRPKTMRPR